jgi:DNA-binding NarL/FixJ family response regulator
LCVSSSPKLLSGNGILSGSRVDLEAMKREAITVLVADDHTIVRRGLVSLLSLGDGIEVIGEASNGREAVDLAVELKPDVVLMDVSMPGLNGIEATERIRKKNPRTRVLVLSAHDRDEYILQVVSSGASGYILKSTSAEDLCSAIRAVHHGQAFFSPSVSKVLANGFKNRGLTGPGQSETPSGRLTSREREVLQLVAEGNTHQRVAALLNISTRTVDTHCNNIMKKLDIHDSAGLVSFAIKNGIVILLR